MNGDREPGWFDDPQDAVGHQQRWWNGEEWTLHVVPTASPFAERVSLTGRPVRLANPDKVERQMLRELQIAQCEMAESGDAIDGRDDGEVSFDGSIDKGAEVIAAHRELLLRAYNVEADQLVDDLTLDRLNFALHALENARRHLDDIGTAVGLRISPKYHDLRRREMELLAQHRGWSDAA